MFTTAVKSSRNLRGAPKVQDGVRYVCLQPHSTLKVSVVQTRCWFWSRCLLGGFGSVGRLNAQQGLDRLQRHALRGLNVHGGSIWPVNDHNPV